MIGNTCPQRLGTKVKGNLGNRSNIGASGVIIASEIRFFFFWIGHKA